jgi:chemotaxis signal transduction protein
MESADLASAHVAFVIAQTRYALPLDKVVHVCPRLAWSWLPGAPAGVLGVFSYHGEPVVAVDPRERLGHPPRPPAMGDPVLVVRGRSRLLGLLCDRVEGVLEGPVRPLPVPAQHALGLLVTHDGLHIVQDVDNLLSLDEERALSELDSLAGQPERERLH